MSATQASTNQPFIRADRNDGEDGGGQAVKPAGRIDKVGTRGTGGGDPTQKPVRSDDPPGTDSGNQRQKLVRSDDPPGTGGGNQEQKPVRSDHAGSSDR